MGTKTSMSIARVALITVGLISLTLSSLGLAAGFADQITPNQKAAKAMGEWTDMKFVIYGLCAVSMSLIALVYFLIKLLVSLNQKQTEASLAQIRIDAAANSELISSHTDKMESLGNRFSETIASFRRSYDALLVSTNDKWAETVKSNNDKWAEVVEKFATSGCPIKGMHQVKPIFDRELGENHRGRGVGEVG